MKVLYSGLSAFAVDVLTAGVEEAYPNLPIDVEQIESDFLEIDVEEAKSNAGVVWVALDGATVGNIGATDGFDKLLVYEDDGSWAGVVAGKLGVDIESLPHEADLSVEGADDEDVSLVGGSEDVPSGGTQTSPGDDTKDRIILNLYAQLAEKEKFLEYMGVDGSLTHGSGDAQKLDKALSENKSLKGKIDTLKESLAKQEMEYTELQSVLNAQDKQLKEATESLRLLEDHEGVFQSEREKLQKEADQLRGTLARVKEERDRLKSSDVELRGTLASLQEEAHADEALKGEYDKVTDELTGVREKLRALEGSYDTLKSDNTSLEASLNAARQEAADANKFLKDANQEILSLNGKVKGYELSEKGMTEQSRKYSELYAELQTVKSTIFNRIGSNAFPKAMGTLTIDALSTGNSDLENVGFLFAGNSESQRVTYKYLRKELVARLSGSVGSSNNPVFAGVGANSKILLVDLSVESSMDYVFRVQGKVRSSIQWWQNGGNLEGYLNDSFIGNVKCLMLGMSFTNDMFLLKVDWEARLKELSDSGYFVIFTGLNLSSEVSRVMMNSIAGVSTVIISTDGAVTLTRNTLKNMQGFSTDSVTAVVIGKTAPAERFYELIKGKVRSLEFVSAAK